MPAVGTWAPEIALWVFLFPFQITALNYPLRQLCVCVSVSRFPGMCT